MEVIQRAFNIGCQIVLLVGLSGHVSFCQASLADELNIRPMPTFESLISGEPHSIRMRCRRLTLPLSKYGLKCGYWCPSLKVKTDARIG